MSDTKKPIEIIYLIQKRLSYIKGVKFNYSMDEFLHKYTDYYNNTDSKILETVLFVE